MRITAKYDRLFTLCTTPSTCPSLTPFCVQVTFWLDNGIRCKPLCVVKGQRGPTFNWMFICRQYLDFLMLRILLLEGRSTSLLATCATLHGSGRVRLVIHRLFVYVSAEPINGACLSWKG